jgi:hypothetical protein
MRSCSPTIITAIKSKRNRLSEHVAHMTKIIENLSRWICRLIRGNLGENNIKVDVTEAGHEDVN